MKSEKKSRNSFKKFREMTSLSRIGEFVSYSMLSRSPDTKSRCIYKHMQRKYIKFNSI